MRDPLQRSLSLTNFNFQRGLLKTIEEAKKNLFSELDNPQTRLFAGVEYMDGECTELTLEKAKSNIKKHFMFVAPTEDTETFLAILASIQEWQPIAISKQQITGAKILESIPDELRDKFIKENAIDIKLHTWVKEQWDLWKKLNIASISTPSDDSCEFLCIMPDFGSTQSATYLSLKEINEYNANTPDKLVDISQQYSSQDKMPKARL